MIELQGVGKSFGDQVALQPIDLAFPEGQVTALIGPSGCGKSTLLRLIVGLVQPTSGEIRVGGRPVGPSTVQELRRGMGYVIQDGGLFPHLSALGNVTLMARHLGWTADRVQARVAELSELTHFPREGLTRYPLELSGGQRQRVALMRGLMLDPPILLLDEPLGALDPLVRSTLQVELKEIFQALHKTVVLVTHDMGEAAFLADEIVLMRDGRIVQQGTLQDFHERPAEPYVTEFLNAQRSVVAL